MSKFSHTDEKTLNRRKRIVALLSLGVIIILVTFLTYFLIIKFKDIGSSGAEFRRFIQGYGAAGIFVAVGIQVLQVVVALIPGEVVEIGIGFSYGWFWGTLVCLLGVSIGSAFTFLMVKKFGIKMVELFVSTDKINELKFINSERKLRRTTFILFFIPGTPKDLLTYFVGLTRMTLGEFLGITLFARIPSVVSSTVGGNFIGDGEYLGALIMFVATGIVSLVGIKIYDILIKRIRKKAESAKEFIHRHKKSKAN